MSHRFSRGQVQALAGTADNARSGEWISNISLKAESRTGLHGRSSLEIGLGSLRAAGFLLHVQTRDISLKYSSTQENHRFVACTLKKGQSWKFVPTNCN